MPAGVSEVVLVGQGLVSAYGAGVERCADGLLAGRRAYRTGAGRGWPAALEQLPAGFAPRGGRADGESPFHGLLEDLFAGVSVPADAALFVATTIGAVDRLEKSVLAGAEPPETESLSAIPAWLAARLGLEAARAQVVSSACASSTAALALAASAIRRGEIDCALVVGADAVSEFVLSGFSALMAVDPGGARPFGEDRKGVTLGEAAAFALLTSRARAERENRPCLGALGGWGLTCDANHLTGPSRDGAPLAEAVRAALALAGCPPEKTTAICAHGTGTLYNDRMEMLAFQRVFGDSPLPTFSVKGGTGHVLGAAGVAETLLALEFLRRGTVPPTVGAGRISEEAAGWVAGEARTIDSSGVLVTTNSGFGGVNAALVVALAPLPAGAPVPAPAFRETKEVCVAAAESSGAETGAAAPPKNFGRFSAEARLAYRAVAEALRAAGLDPVRDPALRVGAIACGPAGSDAANREYFSDYVKSGRTLARGQLFVYTLPTSVAAECAIACRLTGPLVYVADAAGSGAAARRAARGWLADGLADAVVVLASTPAEARAFVVAGKTLGEKENR